MFKSPVSTHKGWKIQKLENLLASSWRRKGKNINKSTHNIYLLSVFMNLLMYKIQIDNLVNNTNDKKEQNVIKIKNKGM